MIGSVVVLIVALAVLGAASGWLMRSAHTGSGGAALPPVSAPGKWHLVFDDEFSGPSLDTSVWSTCYDWGCTNAGNNELEWYQASQVRVHGGTLSLTARHQPSNGKPYISGMVQSNHGFSFTYGYAEVRAKLAPGRGLWPAFWMLPTDHSFPPEIDAMEDYGDIPGWLALSVHFGEDQQISYKLHEPGLYNRFHTFGVDWEPNRVSWYVDGVMVDTQAVAISKPMYLLLNLAIAGKTPPTAATAFPAAFTVDWVRVWQHR